VGGIRRRLEKLEEQSGYQRMTLVCPACSEEFVVFGDAPVEYLTAEWTRETGAESHREIPADIAALFDHEHDPSSLLEKTSGLSWLSREVSGINLGG
jgi:hypothetical protein